MGLISFFTEESEAQKAQTTFNAQLDGAVEAVGLAEVTAATASPIAKFNAAAGNAVGTVFDTAVNVVATAAGGVLDVTASGLALVGNAIDKGMNKIRPGK